MEFFSFTGISLINPPDAFSGKRTIQQKGCDQEFQNSKTELFIYRCSTHAQTLTRDLGQESQHYGRHCCVRKRSYCYQNM